MIPADDFQSAHHITARSRVSLIISLVFSLRPISVPRITPFKPLVVELVHWKVLVQFACEYLTRIFPVKIIIAYANFRLNFLRRKQFWTTSFFNLF